MVSSKNSSKFLFLYFSKSHELFIECGILQKHFSGLEIKIKLIEVNEKIIR
jgi:hypothetical protein